MFFIIIAMNIITIPLTQDVTHSQCTMGTRQESSFHLIIGTAALSETQKKELGTVHPDNLESF